jgi:hypothetical protein
MEPANEQSTPTPLMNHAIKHGVILAVVSIVLVMIFYVVDLSILATFKFILLALLIGLGYVIYSGIDYRKELGGYMAYGKAFQHGFLVLAVSGLISTLFNFLLYFVIDPDLPEKLVDAIITNTEETMTSFGAPQDRIDEQMQQMRNEMPNQFSPTGLALGYAKGLIFYAIIALITSLFVRKNEPVEI